MLLHSDVGCKTVANMIKGKTPEEIRKLYNIVDDFTPEEEVRGSTCCLRTLTDPIPHSLICLCFQAQIKKENVSHTLLHVSEPILMSRFSLGMD